MRWVRINENGEKEYASNPLVVGRYTVISPTENYLIKLGYVQEEEPPMEEIIEDETAVNDINTEDIE